MACSVRKCPCFSGGRLRDDINGCCRGRLTDVDVQGVHEVALPYHLPPVDFLRKHQGLCVMKFLLLKVLNFGDACCSSFWLFFCMIYQFD